jgi:hypothetical protein
MTLTTAVPIDQGKIPHRPVLGELSQPVLLPPYRHAP